MLLAIDVGNTNIMFALVDGATIRWRWRIATNAERTSDEHALVVQEFLGFHGFSFDDDIDGIAISSVVPRATAAFREMAKKYFGFKEDARLRGVEEDGRRFFARDRGRYDIVMIDAYRGTFVPFHLLTKEFFTIVKSRLTPGGVVAQNIEPCTMLYPAAVNTLRATFANVELYEASGNVVAIAYDGPEKTRTELGARAAALQAEHRFYHPLPDLMRGRQIVRRDMPGGQVLVDDFAPAEALAGVARGNDRNAQSRTGLCPH